FLGGAQKPCSCMPMQIDRYMSKSSGPLLDRIDLHLEVPAVAFQELSAKADGTSSAVMREQVFRGRQVQLERFGVDSNILNSRMTTRQPRRHCVLDDDSRDTLKTAMDNLGLSARAHDRILRVARTIADLEGSKDIKTPHLIEAINYRTLDRKLWMR